MAQEILIGVERRRRWSDERKLEILAEVGVDGNRLFSAALIMRPACTVYSRVSSSMATVRGAG